MAGILVLVRHGESEWNAVHRWTGLTDIGLTQKGRQEARDVAVTLKGTHFDSAYTSALIRAAETLTIILDSLGEQRVPVVASAALNERDYGVYTGKNKFEIQKQIGPEEFQRLRRGWDFPIESGESLKQVYARVVPYYQKEILPKVASGQNVLVVAHGNSLRALIKDLDHVSDEDISAVELATGDVLLYSLDGRGMVVSKEGRSVSSQTASTT